MEFYKSCRRMGLSRCIGIREISLGLYICFRVSDVCRELKKGGGGGRRKWSLE